ncbi:hypothetical protein Tco_0989562 [Tanacetum coccineum]|uniref:Uncharacterized protein n=1 Tax=Tanacetum coccineum TaxID=301880 RepID=A0ABQ5EU05_9ASTR
MGSTSSKDYSLAFRVTPQNQILRRITWNDDDYDVIDVLGLDSRETPAARHGFPATRMATSEPPAARLAL